MLATLLLIVFHTARAFDQSPWHIKNDVLTMEMDVLVTFIANWHMPLLFLLAGSSGYYALQRRSASAYLSERVQRLLIPLSFGILLIIPPQVYVERIGTSLVRQSPLDFDGSYWSFYPTFFTQGVYPQGNFSWHHLWFLGYLFVFSALLLPTMRHWLHPGRRHVERFAAMMSCGHRIFLLAVPLIVIQVALIRYFPGRKTLSKT